MAAKERKEYAEQFETMKAALVEAGVETEKVEIFKIPAEVIRKPLSAIRKSGGGVGSGSGSGSGGGASSEELQDALDEIMIQQDKITELSARIRTLQSELADHGDINDARNTVEEYERNSREEIDDETTKLEQAKQAFSIERYQILQDRK
jgi:hypothetical protein